VSGDPTRIRQVLFNFVGNAIKFTERGQVRVHLRVIDARPKAITLRFSVSDSGIGMSDETLTRLFQPFSQADSSMSRRFGGTGLGLVISKKLVEAMQGAIDVQSEPGVGSVFGFTLPFEITPDFDPPRPSPAFVLPQLRGRILVVEDEKVNQRIIAHFLKQMGVESVLAEDGHAAVEKATRESWDAVLMDCQLPGIDGLEATRQIRAELGSRQLPIIALTANAGTEDRKACLAAGMDDFLTKPVRVELLAGVLHSRLRPASG
jgi:CheY-like chemotaxis protein